MAVFNTMFPVLPGKESEARKFAEETLGSQRDRFERLQAASATSRETWTLQETPAGTFVLVWFECDDIEAAFELMTTQTGDDADWLRGRIKDVTGIDMTTPDDGPQPELIMEWPG